MEAIPILISFLFKVFLVFVGARLVYSGLKDTSKGLLWGGFGLIMIPILIIVFQLFWNSILPIPDTSEIVGTYKVSKCRLKVSDEELENCVLKLKSDGTFTITNGGFISGFCEKGLYDVDFSVEGNEIGFKCGKGWRMSGIRRTLWNHTLVLIRDSKGEGKLEFKKKTIE